MKRPTWSTGGCRPLFRHLVAATFYCLSTVIILKLCFAVISSPEDRIEFRGRFLISSSSSSMSDRVSDSAEYITRRESSTNVTLRRNTTAAEAARLLRSIPERSFNAEHLVVHVTWFYQPETNFRFHEALSLLAVQRHVRPRKILFWYDAASTLPSGPWWQFARQSVAHLLPVPIDRPTSVYNRTVRVPELQSDLVRLAVLENHGGLYIDLDLIIVRPIDDLMQRTVSTTGSRSVPDDVKSPTVVVMGAETPEMLGSGFILSPQPNAEFIRLWRQAYADEFVDSDWNRHSVYVPMELARSHPSLVRIEWFTINRPNWYERDWLYGAGRLWDWSANYAVHLWFRDRPRGDVDYDPVNIRGLNTTVGEVFRHIYYGHSRLLPAETTDSTD